MNSLVIQPDKLETEKPYETDKLRKTHILSTVHSNCCIVYMQFFLESAESRQCHEFQNENAATKKKD